MITSQLCFSFAFDILNLTVEAETVARLMFNAAVHKLDHKTRGVHEKQTTSHRKKELSLRDYGRVRTKR